MHFGIDCARDTAENDSKEGEGRNIYKTQVRINPKCDAVTVLPRDRWRRPIPDSQILGGVLDSCSLKDMKT